MSANETKKEVLEFMSALEPHIRQIVRSEVRNCVKAAMATVVSADNDTHMATVKQAYSDTAMTLRNCCGKDLAADDTVVVMWYGSMSNAWIEIKNDGLPWNTGE